jgi:serine/threonine-protein kinase ATR
VSGSKMTTSWVTNVDRRTMAAFLREGLPTEIRNQNRQVALNFLRALSTKDIVGQHETLILAWGRVAV